MTATIELLEQVLPAGQWRVRQRAWNAFGRTSLIGVINLGFRLLMHGELRGGDISFLIGMMSAGAILAFWPAKITTTLTYSPEMPTRLDRLKALFL